MADMLDFAITPLANASMSVPRATIACRIVDSADQSIVLADMTGANAIAFPAVLTTLTPADRVEFANLIAHWLIRKKANLT